MGEEFFKKKPDEFTYQLSQNPLVAKYLLVMVNQGMTSLVNHFNSLEEAERAFNEITNYLSSKPGLLSDSEYHEVSLWEWTDNKYEKVFLYM
jgi:hypothetical protein